MALSQMYPGMSNSPKTSLKNNITSAATSFEVDNANFLPAAPNIAVIGTDQNSEVVIYGAKNGNILTQCIRGAGGTTARAWTQGISVARNFTNLDYTALCNNVRDLDDRKRNIVDKINVGTEVTSVLPVANGGTGQSSLANVKTWLGLAALAFKAVVNLATDITGTLGIGNGGTGLTANPSMLINLASTSAANVFQASPRPGVTGALKVANGGTEATTAAGARTNLSIYSKSEVDTKLNDKMAQQPVGISFFPPAEAGYGGFLHFHYNGRSDVDYTARIVEWENYIEITGKKLSLAAGPLEIYYGGTGLNASPSILINLGSTSAANVLQASPRPGVTGTLGIGNGGTGSSTAAGARSNLGLGNNATGRSNLGITEIATRPNYEVSTTDLTPGSSALATGKLYFYIGD